jgi:putative redox protein
MPTQLEVHADYQGGMRLIAGDDEHSVTVDYPLEPGQTVEGLTPLKLLLVSLAGCAGNTIPLLLARRGQTVSGFHVVARGQRRDEHPTVLTQIDVEFVLRGADLDREVVERCISLAEDRLCPVWAMLRPGTPISTSYRIEA